jgi:hypothetical protein
MRKKVDKIKRLLLNGPQSKENLFKQLYPLGRGCGRVKKTKNLCHNIFIKKK